MILNKLNPSKRFPPILFYFFYRGGDRREEENAEEKEIKNSSEARDREVK